MFRSPDSVQLLYSLWVRKPAKSSTNIIELASRFGDAGFGPAPPMERSLSATSSFEKLSDDFVCVSEEFMVGLTAQGMPDDISLMDKLCTVFRDTDRRDIGKKMWLVCRVYRLGLLNPPPPSKSDRNASMMGGGGAMVKQAKLQGVSDEEPIFRRNYGVGVAELSELEMHTVEAGKRVELTMQLFTPPSSMGGEKG